MIGQHVSRRRHHLPAGRARGSRFTRDALVAIGVAVIAVHIADDNFVQPQPGTSAREHLASGLVPLALLALAAVMYPRLSGCGRAAVALMLGVFGVVAGVEAAYYTIDSGPSGDDYTGLLSIPAGLMLATIGLVLLWTTRRRDGGRRRRLARRCLIGAASIAVAFYIVLPIGISYVSTHIGRLPATRVDLGPTRRGRRRSRRRDGITIAGSYIPSRNGAAVIAFPGRSGPQAHARMLARHGYGVLLFDLRGDGESRGRSERFRVGQRSGRHGRDRLSETASGRRPATDRRAWGSPSAESSCLRPRRIAEDLQAVVSEGAGSRSIGEELGEARRRQMARVIPDRRDDQRRNHGLLQLAASAAPEGSRRARSRHARSS